MLILFILTAGAIVRVRRQRGVLVLDYLEQAVRLNLPLSAMIRAACQSEQGGRRRRLRDLANALERGMSLGDALDRCVPELSPRTLSIIAAAERIGRLPVALKRLVRASTIHRRTRPPNHMLAMAYGLVVAIVLFLILGAVGIFIVPQYQVIFADFDTTMPGLTVFVFDQFTRFSWIVLPFAILAALATAGWSVRSMLHGHEQPRSSRIALADAVLWYLPFAGAAQRDRGMADACELIAEAMRAGMPMHAAAEQASELWMNTVLKKRFASLSAALVHGAALRGAAKDARLPPLAAGMLATASASSDALRVFEFLSRYYASNFSRTVEFLRALVLPLIVLCLALLVGTVVLGLFLPEVKLIHVTTLQAIGTL